MGRPKVDGGVVNLLSIRVSDELMKRIDASCQKRSQRGRALSRADFVREVLWEKTDSGMKEKH